jgi:hypothetical protein
MGRSTDDCPDKAAAARFPASLWQSPHDAHVQVYRGPAQSYARSIPEEYKIVLVGSAGLRVERAGTSHVVGPPLSRIGTASSVQAEPVR